MLNLPLKKYWFTQIASGRKTIEYRKATNYWETRLSKLSSGDQISLSLGYSKTRLYYHIAKIDLLSCGIETDLKETGPVYAIYLSEESARQRT